MRLVLVCLAAFALVAIPALSVAQSTHDHPAGKDGETIVALHDLHPVTGRAVVGAVSHFGFALVDKEGVPVAHKDATFTLIQNGVTLFKSADTHEYDGLFSFDYTFTVPGPYEVHVESATGAMGVFNGTAVLPRGEIPVMVMIEAPPQVAAGSPAALGIRVVDGAGTIVNHSDAILEVRRVDNGLLVLRTHLHSHVSPMALALNLALPGEYEAVAWGYPAFTTGRFPDYRTAMGHAVFTVAPPVGGALPLPAAKAPASPLARAADPGHDDGEHGPKHVLSLTLDPEDTTGPLNHHRVSAFVWDPTAKAALQHVDFEARIVRGDGAVVFESASLHEYDGHLEVVLSALAPGKYVWSVKASALDWEAEGTREFTVLPPVVPLGAGPARVMVYGAEDLKAGEPAEIAFAFESPPGVNVPHSEIDFTIFPVADPTRLLLNAKIHAHMDPPKATITFPEPGEYVIRAEGDSLQPSAPLYVGMDGSLKQSASLVVKVVEGPGLPFVDTTPPLVTAEAPPEVRALPSAGLALAAAALAGAALVAARRRG